MIDFIDSLNTSEVITEVETDSIGNILDTLSVTYVKYDDKNCKRFTKKTYWYKGRKSSWIDYFKPDKNLFYRESFNEKGETNSVFETKSNFKGKIEKAIQINTEGDQIDTTLMDYSHIFYSNGNIKELQIKSFHEEVGELVIKINYDEYEKPLSEVMVLKKDTTSFQIWEYLDTILEKSIYTNYLRDTSKSIYYFEKGELLIDEEEFNLKNGDFIKSKEINHFYNDVSIRTKTIETNSMTKAKRYIKFLVEK